MFYTIGKPLLLSLLNNIEWNNVDSRPIIPIAVIDDQKFPYCEMLRQLKYNITEVGDISDITHIKEYGIVICDIKGVGKTFGSKSEGGYVIKEIRNRYPDKYIISFSGSRFDPTFKKFFDCCDTTIKKDSDIEEWTTTLDYAVKELTHPLQRWHRTRDILLKNGAELVDVLAIEQAYIKSVVNKNPSFIKKTISNNPSIQSSAPLIEIGISLVSFIVKLLLSGN